MYLSDPVGNFSSLDVTVVEVENHDGQQQPHGQHHQVVRQVYNFNVRNSDTLQYTIYSDIVFFIYFYCYEIMVIGSMVSEMIYYFNSAIWMDHHFW